MLFRLQFWRFTFFLLAAFFAIGIPIWIICDEYHVFDLVSKSQYKGMGLILILVVIAAFFLLGKLIGFIRNMEPSNLKTVIIQVFKISPLLGLYFALKFAEPAIQPFETFIMWTFFSNVIASLFEIAHQHFVRAVKDYHTAKKSIKIDKLKVEITK